MKQFTLIAIIVGVLTSACTRNEGAPGNHPELEAIAGMMQGVWINTNNDTTALVFDSLIVSDNSYQGTLYTHFQRTGSDYSLYSYSFHTDEITLYMIDNTPRVGMRTWQGIKRELEVILTDDQIKISDHEVEYSKIRDL
jgi:hypothetical protein